jgi:hypothetical protein
MSISLINNYLPHLNPPLDGTTYDVALDELCFVDDTLDEDFDYLIVNGYPVSPVLLMSRAEQDANFEAFLAHLTTQGKKVITTMKVNGYRSTQDYGMTLVDIGRLAKRCKAVVGVPNAPFIAATNKWALDSVEQFVCLMDRVNTRFPYHDMARTIDLNDKFRTVKTLYELIP